jgi:hypothetical protein
MTSLYLAIVVAAAVLAWLAVVPHLRLRIVSIAALICMTIMLPLSYFDTLSRPKPLDDETRNDELVEVVSYAANPGVALWLWLALPGVDEPRYYVMPWSEEARKITQQLQDGREGGQRMMMINPFEPSLEKERTVHPLPQFAPPPKIEPPKPKEYGI